jgi:protein TonB
MKRRFALPAAIALTAHALLFMGVGKPPVPPIETVALKVKEKDKPKEDDEIAKTVQLINNEIKTATNPTEKSAGGSSEDPPPGIPEIPRPEGPSNRWEITQNPSTVIPGHGKITTNLSVSGPGTGEGNGWGSAIETIASLDNPPRTRFQKPPIYPNAMKTAGNSGTVWVEFVVDETGRVHDVRVLKSTHPGFEDATVTAVSEWRFESGKRKGIPVRFRMSIPVVFNLSE